MKNIRPIRTEQDYDWALEQISKYFDNQPAPGTPDADRFDILSSLIETYESKNWNIEAADPVEAIKYALELDGLKQSDLAVIIGSRSRASEILNRRRPLTLGMIQLLVKELRLPSDILIQPYHLETQ